MEPKTVVFLGPSFNRTKAADQCPAVYRPPARRGDISVAVENGARTIILIDGLLVYDYSPSPMEIANAIQRRVRVVGAASLGALRAMELRHCGMHGVGWVFDKFLSGAINADDEVVVRVGEDDQEALTVPLVNLRYAAEALVTKGLLQNSLAQKIIRETQNLYFEDRTNARIAAIADRFCVSAEITQLLLDSRYDIKQLDTKLALSYACTMFDRGGI